MRMVAIVAAVLGLGPLNGCRDNPERGQRFSHDRPMRIALIGPNTTSERWDFIARGAVAQAREHGSIEIEVLRSDVLARAGGVAETAGYRPDALIVWVDSPEAQAPALRDLAREYGVVVTIGAQAPGVWGHVQFPADEAAGMIAERLPALMGDRRTYLLMHADGRDAMSTLAYRRFQAESNRNFNLVAVSESHRGDGGNPIERVAEMHREFPSAALAVVLDPDAILQSRPETLRSLGLPLVALGATPGLWPWLREGRCVALCGVIAGDAGREAVQMALEAYSPDARPGGFARLSVEWVTPQNLATFTERFAASVGMNVRELNPGRGGVQRP